jgi:hypothetical protein
MRPQALHIQVLQDLRQAGGVVCVGVRADDMVDTARAVVVLHVVRERDTGFPSAPVVDEYPVFPWNSPANGDGVSAGVAVPDGKEVIFNAHGDSLICIKRIDA